MPLHSSVRNPTTLAEPVPPNYRNNRNTWELSIEPVPPRPVHSRNLAPRITSFAAADGYRFAVRVWEVTAPAGRVLVIPGIISHGGWYLRSCGFLAQQGLEVHALDRRGSGLNMEARGDAVGYCTWLTDVESYLQSLPAGLPNVVLGISWGGKLAAALARYCGQMIQGVGLLCPGSHAQQQANLLQRSLLRAAGWSGLSRARIAIPLRDPALFTDTPQWRDYIRDDPLTLRRITIRWALADLQLNEYARGAAEHIQAATLLMLAGRERIVDNRRTRDFFQRIAAADKTCIEYPDAAHTLEFEADPTGYLQDLSTWLGKRGQASAAGSVALLAVARRCGSAGD